MYIGLGTRGRREKDPGGVEQMVITSTGGGRNRLYGYGVRGVEASEMASVGSKVIELSLLMSIWVGAEERGVLP